MALLIHTGIADVEKRLAKLMTLPPRIPGQSRPDPFGLVEKAGKLRNRFRKKLRDVSDLKVELKSSTNGDSSFRIWMAGFECARNIEAQNVYYFSFAGSSSSVIIHTIDCQEKSSKIVDEYEKKIKELEDNNEVANVMLS